MAKASDDGGVGGRDEGEGDILTWQWRCGWGGGERKGGEGRGWEGKGGEGRGGDVYILFTRSVYRRCGLDAGDNIWARY